MNAIVRSALFLLFFVAASSAAAAPLASAPMNVDGLEIDLLAVERRANVLTVKWAVRNTSDKAQYAEFALVNKPTTYVVDEESGTKYYVLTDKEGQALATDHKSCKGGSYGISERLDGGQTQRFWMKLPAPPPAVKTINILFTDASEPFEAVPITDK